MLSRWFSVAEEKKIDKKNQMLYASFAVIMFHVINADGIHSSEEKERFFNYFKNYFELDQAIVLELYNDILKFEGDFDKHLEILKQELENFLSVKVDLMREINTIIQSDGIDDREYEVFERVRVALS